MTTTNDLLARAKTLKFYGVIEHHEEIVDKTELLQLLFDWEESARTNRGLTRRLHSARLGRLKPLALFDWNWPKKIDRDLIEELMKVDFIKEATKYYFMWAE